MDTLLGYEEYFAFGAHKAVVYSAKEGHFFNLQDHDTYHA